MQQVTKCKWALWGVLIVFALLHLPNFFAATFSHVRFWEQADRAAISRNFSNESMNILYPRIDLRGNTSGIEGTEFPLYHYLVGAVYKVSGHDWTGYGKILSLLCALIAISAFYRLACMDIGGLQQQPLLVLLLLSSVALTPFFFRFSVLFMPDMFALAFAVLSFYFMHAYWQQSRNHTLLVLSLLCLAVATVSRPYYGFFALPYIELLVCFFRISFARGLALVFGLVVALLPFVLWYYVWVPHLDQAYGVGGYFFMGTPIMSNIMQIAHHPLSYINHLVKILLGFYLGWVLLPFFLHGLYLLASKKLYRMNSRRTRHLLSIAFIALLLVPCLSGTWLFKQRYYLGAIYPGFLFVCFVSIACLYKKSKRILVSVLVVLLLAMYIGSIASYSVPNRITMTQAQRHAVLRGVNPTDLVVTVSSQAGNPIYLYLLNRKGWALGYQANHRPDMGELNRLRSLGARYILFVSNDAKTGKPAYKMMRLN